MKLSFLIIIRRFAARIQCLQKNSAMLTEIPNFRKNVVSKIKVSLDINSYSNKKLFFFVFFSESVLVHLFNGFSETRNYKKYENKILKIFSCYDFKKERYDCCDFFFPLR